MQSRRFLLGVQSHHRNDSPNWAYRWCVTSQIEILSPAHLPRCAVGEVLPTNYNYFRMDESILDNESLFLPLIQLDSFCMQLFAPHFTVENSCSDSDPKNHIAHIAKWLYPVLELQRALTRIQIGPAAIKCGFVYYYYYYYYYYYNHQITCLGVKFMAIF